MPAVAETLRNGSRLAAVKVRRTEAVVIASLNPWLESMRFACEVQAVVAMRLMFLAHGGPEAEVVAEKVGAFADAEAALAKALFVGENIMVAAEHAYAPVRSRVHANNDRLAHAID
jgi:hypothetical protein